MEAFGRGIEIAQYRVRSAYASSDGSKGHRYCTVQLLLGYSPYAVGPTLAADSPSWSASTNGQSSPFDLPNSIHTITSPIGSAADRSRGFWRNGRCPFLGRLFAWPRLCTHAHMQHPTESSMQHAGPRIPASEATQLWQRHSRSGSPGVPWLQSSS